MFERSLLEYKTRITDCQFFKIDGTQPLAEQLTDINWSLNREEITALEEPGKTRDIGNGWFVGSPLNVIYDYKKIGIWQAKDAALRRRIAQLRKS